MGIGANEDEEAKERAKKKEIERKKREKFCPECDKQVSWYQIIFYQMSGGMLGKYIVVLDVLVIDQMK